MHARSRSDTTALPCSDVRCRRNMQRRVFAPSSAWPYTPTSKLLHLIRVYDTCCACSWGVSLPVSVPVFWRDPGPLNYFLSRWVKHVKIGLEILAPVANVLVLLACLRAVQLNLHLDSTRRQLPWRPTRHVSGKAVLDQHSCRRLGLKGDLALFPT